MSTRSTIKAYVLSGLFGCVITASLYGLGYMLEAPLFREIGPSALLAVLLLGFVIGLIIEWQVC